MKMKEQLIQRLQYLQQVAKEKEKALLKAPKGTLRVMKDQGNIRYYQRNDTNHKEVIYLTKDKISLARELAQKDYDEKVLRAVNKELSAIEKYMYLCPEISAEQIYERLHKGRQILVTPIQPSDEEYLRSWEAVKYEGKGFGEEMPEYYSMKGERVRSKAKIILANMLYQEGVSYRYEYPLYLKGMGEIHPDFTVLNVRLRKEIYWEHLGMMDDDNYAERAVKKINCYMQNGYFPGEQVIFTYETKQTPISQRLIKELIYRYCY